MTAIKMIQVLTLLSFLAAVTSAQLVQTPIKQCQPTIAMNDKVDTPLKAVVGTHGRYQVGHFTAQEYQNQNGIFDLTAGTTPTGFSIMRINWSTAAKSAVGYRYIMKNGQICRAQIPSQAVISAPVITVEYSTDVSQE